MVLERRHLGAAQAMGDDAARLRTQHGHQAVDLRAIAATIVEQWQPERHQQQPAQRGAAGWQYQALPDHGPVARGAPPHQRTPGSGGNERERESDGRKVRHKRGSQTGHVGRRFDGTPVCSDSQITQIVMAEALKKSRVNQSISDAMARRSVGSANAANAARAGSPSSKARSAGWVVMVAPSVTTVNHKGSNRWRCMARLVIWWRQRHRVHNANGQAGHANQVSRRSRLCQSFAPCAAHDAPTP